MSEDPLSRLFQIEQGEECYIRPSWNVTLATEHNCDELGVIFDPHVNKAVFVHGIIDKNGEVSMARSKPQFWDVNKKWQPFLIVPAEDLSLPEIKNNLSNHWIGPSHIQKARDLIASEGYAIPRAKEKPTNVVALPVPDESGTSMQMATQDFPQLHQR